MEQYRTEEEQLEALKRWWEENGRSTITAVIFAVALGFGWQGWQKYRQEQAEAASNTYQSMMQSYAQHDEKAAASSAATLKQDYAGSTYAQFAALQLARVAVGKGDLDTAERELRWVLAHADSGSDVMQLAQLRLARVLAASGDNAQALSILESAESGDFPAAVQVARGDILLEQGRRDEAQAAYSSALMLSGSSGENVNTPLLQAKLRSLTPEPPADLPAAEPAAISGQEPSTTPAAEE